jgi:hypothetical protein
MYGTYQRKQEKKQDEERELHEKKVKLTHQALNLCQLAVMQDSNGNYPQALELYTQSLEYFMALRKCIVILERTQIPSSGERSSETETDQGQDARIYESCRNSQKIHRFSEDAE